MPTSRTKLALLAGACLSFGTGHANADELASLKAQLEALQARVDTLQASPAASGVPAGASYVTFERGQGSLGNWGADPRDRIGNNPDAGYTIAITPTADMPAPVAEIVVYGYVKGDVIFDGNGMTNKYSFSLQSLAPAYENGDYGDDYVNLHAFQTRFGIKSKVDTAVGQIRTHVQGDFFGKGSQGGKGDLRLRQAYGEWDMAPGWALLVGQTDYLENVTNIGIPFVDFFEESGPLGRTRVPQVRVTYTDGPLTWAVAIEDPTWDSATVMPNIAGFIGYQTSEGNSVQLTGVVADYDVDSESGSYEVAAIGSCPGGAVIGYAADGSPVYATTTPCGVVDETSSTPEGIGWAIMGGASYTIGSFATVNVGANYGFGEVVPQLNQTSTSNQRVDADGNLMEAWSVQGALMVPINETTSFNLGAGYEDYLGALAEEGWIDSAVTVHANILWQPVKQMRLGWEVMWGQINYAGEGYCLDVSAEVSGNDATLVYDGCKTSFDDARFQFGAWFYF